MSDSTETKCEACNDEEEHEICDSCGSCEWAEHTTCDGCGECTMDHIECVDCGECTETHDTCWECNECLDSHEACSTCGECIEYHVEMCDDCGDCKDGCGCDQGHGSSQTPPWVNRGIHVDTTGKSKWANTYPELSANNGKIDPLVAAAEFYILEAIAAGVIHPVQGVTATAVDGGTEFFDLVEVDAKMRTKMTKARNKRLGSLRTADPDFNLSFVMGQAEALLDEAVDYLDPILVQYFHLACGGELRHHKAIGGNVLSGDRGTAWAQWYAVFEQVGIHALDDMADLFEEFDGEGYGGELWADAARVLRDRLTGDLGPDERMNKRMFVDRAWTLEHNGGCFLNKLSWGQHNPRDWNFGDYMSRLLGWHSADEPKFASLLSMCGPAVREAYTQFHEAASVVLVSRGVEAPASHLGDQAVRRLCGSCNSNPDLGHYIGCVAARSHDIAGSVIIINEHEWDDWSWQRWEADVTRGSHFNVDGVLVLDPTQKVKAVVHSSYRSDDDGVHAHALNAFGDTHQVADDALTIMAKEFIPVDTSGITTPIVEVSFSMWLTFYTPPDADLPVMLSKQNVCILAESSYDTAKWNTKTKIIDVINEQDFETQWMTTAGKV